MNSSIEQREKQGKRFGAIMTISIHAVLLLLFLFLLAWQPPDPPIPSYGVELNFGLDAAGSGDVQSESPANNQEEEQQQEETPPPPPQETEPIEAEEPTPTPSEVESPHFVEPKEVKKPVEQPKTEPKKEITPQPSNQPSDSKKSSNAANNNGDQANKVGDQGDPKGSLEAKALYGNAGKGGGGGSSLDMAGWVWDAPPRPKDESNEEGKIVFQVEVDDQGEIISVKTIEKTVSPAVERIYRQEVERLTFSKTKDNSGVAPRSIGKITFIIRSR
jgi:outer membrane biosynthesis protein TonB